MRVSATLQIKLDKEASHPIHVAEPMLVSEVVALSGHGHHFDGADERSAIPATVMEIYRYRASAGSVAAIWTPSGANGYPLT